MKTNFKKLTSVCLAVIMMLSVLTVAPITAGAAENNSESEVDTYTSGDFEYQIVGDWCIFDIPRGTAMITGYTGNMSDLNIPAQLDGYSVSSIGMHAFENCNTIENLTIPDSVVMILVGAFYGCENLKKIYIEGENLNHIFMGAFAKCKNLEKINIPNSVRYLDGVSMYGYGVFQECTSLTEITLPNNIKEIDCFNFSGCTSLTSIIIPDSVTEIGDWAFSDCTSLASITIPNGVTEIGHGAFSGCTSLANITIPNGVTEIGDYTFSRCANLTIYGYVGSAAETYANENGFDFVPINDYSDLDTKISVTAGTNAELKVAEITDINEIEHVNLKLQNEKVESLYDISFVKDGTTVQPVGTATVKIPCTNENSKVYRVETDGSLNDMNAAYDNGYMVFTTNHFSRYVLTEEKADVLFGDVDGDGKISIDDVTDIQKHLANMVDFTKEQVLLADVDKNGTVSIDDVTLIQKHLAGLAVIE